MKLSVTRQRECAGLYLFKQINRGFGVLMKQIIKDQKETCQDERHRAHLSIHVDTQLLDALDKKSQNGLPALLREVVENEEQQLQVFYIQIFSLTGYHPLQGILLHCRQKPSTEKRGAMSDGKTSEIPPKVMTSSAETVKLLISRH
jgi:hypothetical protein